MAQDTEVRVPDIGDFEDVEVIEVLVAVGDPVETEDSLITLESDKATMEIPSPVSGVVGELRVSEGDRVSEGSLVVVIAVSEGSAEPGGAPGDESSAAPPESEAVVSPQAPPQPQPPLEEAAAEGSPPPSPTPRPAPSLPPVSEPAGDRPHASPLVRGFARELGVDLSETAPSGPARRIVLEDVKGHVRDRMAGGGSGIPPVPEIDFAKFGPVEEVALSKIRRVSATNLHRSWLNVPHVTQHDEADITDLEIFRKSRADVAKARGLRLSPLLFVMKAVVIALRRFPDFRSSLAPGGQSLVRKNFYHLGIAVDTEEGLVVPCIRDVDRKSIFELAEELSDTAERARNRKLGMKDLQGSVFTISSLGGIGGTAFTPIVNAPEVGILGVSRTAVRPSWCPGDGEGEGAFEPRQMLPLSLSYDHRVIDGALAARFAADLVATLSNPATLLV
ncbi:MAG: 2-oxo acid dehydrogenase subunit E2 [Myxococcota bacterium]|nr:2-oxo acid dehydrogenase subunit E2 [Myxococcota bacterium]